MRGALSFIVLALLTAGCSGREVELYGVEGPPAATAPAPTAEPTATGERDAAPPGPTDAGEKHDTGAEAGAKDAGGDAAPAVDAAPDACVPSRAACGSAGQCGDAPDGCGGTVNCGTCRDGYFCGAGGASPHACVYWFDLCSKQRRAPTETCYQRKGIGEGRYCDPALTPRLSCDAIDTTFSGCSPAIPCD